MSAGDGEPLYASIAVPVPLRRLFTYRVPSRLRPGIEPGTRVRVPLGRQRVVGTVVEWPATAPSEPIEIRDVEAILEHVPRPDGSLLAITRFLSDYYLCSWGEAIEAALPPAPPSAATHKLVRRLPGAHAGLVPARAAARRRVLEALPPDGSAIPLGRLGASGRRVVPALAALGLVQVVERADAGEEGEQSSVIPQAPPKPTPNQAAVLAQLLPAVSRRAYAPYLLYGATGSGKTEVYLRAAEASLALGRGVLYLVPEIGLTPLLTARLSRRFPNEVAVLHSGLSPRERHLAWERVRLRRCRFAVGARSAIFAPVADLGLLVVDEEQDASYKQQDTPRYNARDLAIVRARESRAVVLLGSATPSLESFHHARSGRYTLLALGGRVEARPLPGVRIVDMREEFRASGSIRPLSRFLVEALRECLGRGEQALVLRNRRGWAAALLCPSCGSRVACSQCTISMTWHDAARRLRCHYCGLERPMPPLCPTCGAGEMKLLGEGSERIEHELHVALPGARISRMDRDTVRKRGAHEALLRRFERGEIDVLVGTQMIAKGHDFPRVTLVGVISADQTLGLPDFRAGERTFQLLTQVAGRAGRGEQPGAVVVQAFDPSHPVLQEAALQDYDAFYEREVRYRRALRYPPLTAMVQLLVTDRREGRAAEWAEILAAALRHESEGRLIVAGPGPAPIERLKAQYRQQILVRSAGRRRMVSAVGRALAAVEGKKIPRRAIHVDVDPVSLL